MISKEFAHTAIGTTFAFGVRDLHRRGMGAGLIAERLRTTVAHVMEAHRA